LEDDTNYSRHYKMSEAAVYCIITGVGIVTLTIIAPLTFTGL
jgi:hypothetical protein